VTASTQWGFPLASASMGSDRLGFVGSPVGLRAPTTPSLFMWRCAKGDTAIHDKRPRFGRRLDWFSNFGDLSKRKGDHISNILPLDLHISS
jgi:hypothetical protein